jgi:tetratricopeptide (TPR) repeat protein
MSKRTLKVIALFAAALTVAVAQKKPKSDKETQAIQAIQKAKTPDEIIAAVENLITKFADTEFKSAALLEEAQAYDQKGDSIKAISSGRLAIEADPKNVDALLLVGAEVAQHTRDTDLDKTERLAEAEKDINAALAIIPDEPKPAASVTDAQWEEAKKNSIARVHFDLGLVAMTRKKPDVAANEYKLAVDGSTAPDPVWMIRLGNAYNQAGKPDDAIAVLDKALAVPDLNPQIKNIAANERANAVKLKGAKK